MGSQGATMCATSRQAANSNRFEIVMKSSKCNETSTQFLDVRNSRDHVLHSRDHVQRSREHVFLNGEHGRRSGEDARNSRDHGR